MPIESNRANRFVLPLIVAMVALLGAPQAGPDLPGDASVPVSEAEGYLGVWVLALSFQGNPFEVILEMTDANGMVAATVDSALQSEPLDIDRIGRTEKGLKLVYDVNFGDRAVTMSLDPELVEGKLIGAFAEASSEMFSADFEGIKQTDNGIAARRRLQGTRRGRVAKTEDRINLSGNKIRVSFGALGYRSEDYKNLDRTADGEVFTFVGSRATKLFTDSDLSFGGTIVKANNVAEDYPGVYSLWLKRVGDGWSLVFNEEPDIWGTRHDASSDIAEVPLTLTERDSPQKRFLIDLEEKGQDGLMRIAWGPHEWTTEFALVQ